MTLNARAPNLPGLAGLIIIDNRYYRFSTGTGGNALDLLVKEFGLPFREAVMELTGFASSHQGTTTTPLPTPSRLPACEEDRPFSPPTCKKNAEKLMTYLTGPRCLPGALVETLLAEEVIY